MRSITATEFKRNFGKYNKLAQKEEIEVTFHDRVMYRLVPGKMELLKQWDNVFDSIVSDDSKDKKEDK